MSIKKNVSRLKMVELAKKSYTLSAIGDIFGVTRQRVRQILGDYNINTRKIKAKNKSERYKLLVKEIKPLLKKRDNVSLIRNKFGLNNYDVTNLFNDYNIDLRILKKEESDKRNKLCLKLYKQGNTANEILEQLPELKTINDIYRYICKSNNGVLPKRINTRNKLSLKLTSEIKKLKNKGLTFTSIHKKLVTKGITNSNKTPLRLNTIIYNYYK